MRRALALPWVLLAACSGGGTAGTLGGPCRADGTCLTGLVCASNTCVSGSIDARMNIDASDSATDVAPGPDVTLPDVTYLPDGDPMAPVVSIYHPGDGEIRMATSTIPFIGMGNDYTGAMLTGPQLIWTDSFGTSTVVMGTGTFVGYSLRTVGDHLITLTGVDRFGHAANTQITVTAQ